MSPDTSHNSFGTKKDKLTEVTAGMIDGKKTPLYTLPARWYHAQDIYEAERWSVFAGTWQFICR